MNRGGYTFYNVAEDGDTSRPSCWRPIAILKMSYKIFSKLICQRLRATLDSHQSIDQTGFRPGTGIEGAKTILRIIMETLSESKFSIQRGVKQGDVISPILFKRCFGAGNAEMETQTVASHGLVIAGKKISNIRYADDLMLYTRSLQDLKDMTELLITELGAVGLQFNASKTKILTTFSGSRPMHVELAGDSVEIVSGRSKHKYLGKTLVGDLRHRAEVELGHSCTLHGRSFTNTTNKHVALKLRLIFLIRFCLQFYLVWPRCHSLSLNCNDWTLPNGRCSEQLSGRRWIQLIGNNNAANESKTGCITSF